MSVGGRPAAAGLLHCDGCPSDHQHQQRGRTPMISSKRNVLLPIPCLLSSLRPAP